MQISLISNIQQVTEIRNNLKQINQQCPCSYILNSKICNETDKPCKNCIYIRKDD